jgi:hypothetical protein
MKPEIVEENDELSEEGKRALMKLLSFVAGVIALYFFYKGHTTEFNLSNNRLVKIEAEILRPPKYHEQRSGKSTTRWIEFKISTLEDSLIFPEENFEAINVDRLLNDIEVGDKVVLRAPTNYRWHQVKDTTMLYDTDILGFSKGGYDFFEYERYTESKRDDSYTFFFMAAYVFIAAGMLGLYDTPKILGKEIPSTYILIFVPILILWLRM